MKKTIILDFDGTFYQTPCHDIPKLEDAIDLSQLKLLKDKLKQAPNAQEVLRLLDARFEKLDKYKITANLYNQNAGNPGHTSKALADRIVKENIPFSELLQKKDPKIQLFCARALAQMLIPNGEENHRVSGMLNLGLNITQEDIADYYRKYATISYKTAKPNIYVRNVIKTAKKRGDVLVIYTDNSKQNILANLKKLGYKKEYFAAIVDMFDCNGGMTKKMQEGRKAFAEIMHSKGIDIQNAEFYDDNPKICRYLNEHLGLTSIVAQTNGLTNVVTGEKKGMQHISLRVQTEMKKTMLKLKGRKKSSSVQKKIIKNLSSYRQRGVNSL